MAKLTWREVSDAFCKMRLNQPSRWYGVMHPDLYRTIKIQDIVWNIGWDGKYSHYPTDLYSRISRFIARVAGI